MHVSRSRLAAAMSALRKPRYNGKCLRNLIRSMLGETRVSDTLTNVIIPTFDVRLLQPIIFSTYDVRTSSPSRTIQLYVACTWQPTLCAR
jgi:patatin-like phospholipase/acyl hydrolase